MTDCESVTDRIPVVALGRDAWTAEEAAHLASCPACQAEWKVVETARRLGDSAARRVDPDRVNSIVIARLRADRRWRRAAWIGAVAVAAAMALVVWTARPTHQAGPIATRGAVGFHLPLAELDRLDSGQLERILEDLEAPLGAQAAPEAPELGDLKDSELERVLRTLEG
jgi:anti-sigma factor RsiW